MVANSQFPLHLVRSSHGFAHATYFEFHRHALPLLSFKLFSSRVIATMQYSPATACVPGLLLLSPARASRATQKGAEQCALRPDKFQSRRRCPSAMPTRLADGLRLGRRLTHSVGPTLRPGAIDSPRSTPLLALELQRAVLVPPYPSIY